MEQLAEIAPMVQILDAPVPQSVVQLVEVLKPCDTMVPEQVIDVPKITSTDVIPHRAVLRVPQKAEQLVDEPVPSFDDFELVQEEEKEAEDEHPQVVPLSRVRDAHGRSWCRVVGPAGVYWWMIGTSTAQYTLPGGDHRQARAVNKYWSSWWLWWVTSPVTMQRQFPASSSSSCLRSSSSTEWWTFQFCSEWRSVHSGCFGRVLFPRKPGHHFYVPLFCSLFTCAQTPLGDFFGALDDEELAGSAGVRLPGDLPPISLSDSLHR